MPSKSSAACRKCVLFVSQRDPVQAVASCPISISAYHHATVRFQDSAPSQRCALVQTRRIRLPDAQDGPHLPVHLLAVHLPAVHLLVVHLVAVHLLAVHLLVVHLLAVHSLVAQLPVVVAVSGLLFFVSGHL